MTRPLSPRRVALVHVHAYLAALGVGATAP